MKLYVLAIVLTMSSSIFAMNTNCIVNYKSGDSTSWNVNKSLELDQFDKTSERNYGDLNLKTPDHKYTVKIHAINWNIDSNSHVVHVIKVQKDNLVTIAEGKYRAVAIVKYEGSTEQLKVTCHTSVNK